MSPLEFGVWGGILIWPFVFWKNGVFVEGRLSRLGVLCFGFGPTANCGGGGVVLLLDATNGEVGAGGSVTGWLIDNVEVSEDTLFNGLFEMSTDTEFFVLISIRLRGLTLDSKRSSSFNHSTYLWIFLWLFLSTSAMEKINFLMKQVFDPFSSKPLSSATFASQAAAVDLSPGDRPSLMLWKPWLIHNFFNFKASSGVAIFRSILKKPGPVFSPIFFRSSGLSIWANFDAFKSFGLYFMWFGAFGGHQKWLTKFSAYWLIAFFSSPRFFFMKKSMSFLARL